MNVSQKTVLVAALLSAFTFAADPSAVTKPVGGVSSVPASAPNSGGKAPAPKPGMTLPPPMPAPGASIPAPVATKPASVAKKISLDKSALKQSKPGALNLPGLGKMGDAEKSPLNSQVIRMSSQNEIVYISNSLPNRIATPFTDPKVVDLSNSDIRVVGQDVYITPAQSDQPIGIYIRDGAEPQSPVLNLTLVPKSIPGQNVSIVTEQAFKRNGKSVEAPEIASDYIGQIKVIMRQVIAGGVPAGFTESDLKVGVAKVGNILAVPEKIYSGQSMNLYRYALENIGKDGVEMSEQSFYHDGVRAVSFFPKIRLAPRERTTVFILADKQEGEE